MNALPVYMSYGMSIDEFWNGPPILCKVYREAYKNRMRQENQMAHIQASYIYEVLCDVSPLYDSFAKKRKPTGFRDQPYDLFPEDAKETEKRRIREKQEEMKARLRAMSQRIKK